jgi:hypothetical protein
MVPLETTTGATPNLTTYNFDGSNLVNLNPPNDGINDNAHVSVILCCGTQE